MIAELGAFALMLALALSGLQVGLSVAARLRHDAALRGAGEGAHQGFGARGTSLISPSTFPSESRRNAIHRS